MLKPTRILKAVLPGLAILGPLVFGSAAIGEVQTYTPTACDGVFNTHSASRYFAFSKLLRERALDFIKSYSGNNSSRNNSFDVISQDPGDTNPETNQMLSLAQNVGHALFRFTERANALKTEHIPFTLTAEFERVVETLVNNSDLQAEQILPDISTGPAAVK